MVGGLRFVGRMLGTFGRAKCFLPEPSAYFFASILATAALIVAVLVCELG